MFKIFGLGLSFFASYAKKKWYIFIHFLNIFHLFYKEINKDLYNYMHILTIELFCCYCKGCVLYLPYVKISIN